MYAGMCGSPDTRPGQCLQLLPSQQAVLESVLQTIGRGWMCILVGGAGVGKTSLARTAAQLAGRQLTEIALTGGTDTADLLGGFEQLEPKRKVQVSQFLLSDGCHLMTFTPLPCFFCCLLLMLASSVWCEDLVLWHATKQ